jgi:hypothetical protein
MDPSDVSNSSQVFAPSMPQGFTIPDNPKDWYSYPLNFVNLAVATTELVTGGVPQTLTLQIDAAADFYWTSFSFIAQVHGNATALTYGTSILPLAQILINDGGSNRNLMQNPVFISQIAGDGRWPHKLQHPRLFKKNSTITVTMQNFDANNAYDVLVNFEGFKMYGT